MPDRRFGRLCQSDPKSQPSGSASYFFTAPFLARTVLAVCLPKWGTSCALKQRTPEFCTKEAPLPQQETLQAVFTP